MWLSGRLLFHSPFQSFLHEERQRSRVAVQKIAVADRPDFAVAEKAGQTQRAQLLLNQTRIVVRLAEKAVAAPVATAEAGAVNRGLAELFFRARQQRQHVFGRGRGVPSSKLNRLPRARKSAAADAARSRVGDKQVETQMMDTMKIIQIHVHEQTHDPV